MSTKDGVITIQKSEYIEDGFYIEILNEKITLYEIPSFGGEPVTIKDCNTLIEAIELSKTLI